MAHRQPKRSGRRVWDDVYYWMPIIISIVTTALSLGITYGALTGRLTMIEYRLSNIELRMPVPPLLMPAPAPKP